jgi:CubicO group peptidase (beta-lactamase class C family)
VQPLTGAIDAIASETGFSGIVRVDHAGADELMRAYGLADRAHGIPNAVDTQFGLASGGKTLTALTVVSLIVDGALELDTTARSVLGDDLPLIAEDVTIEQLLAHRSGIDDYLDEHDGHEISDYVMPVSVHTLTTTEDFVGVLGGHPTVFPAGERFVYNNGGFVVLALIAERTTGVPYHDLVGERVTEPAGMVDTTFLRSDELPGRAALGYLDDGPRTNVFHLPVRGNGDGGIYSTAADISSLWRALFAGWIVPERWVAEMIRPRSEVPENEARYGLGFWLHATSAVVAMEGYDAGVSFRSEHDPATGTTHTVISNTSEGAWPVKIRLAELVGLEA